MKSSLIKARASHEDIGCRSRGEDGAPANGPTGPIVPVFERVELNPVAEVPNPCVRLSCRFRWATLAHGLVGVGHTGLMRILVLDDDEETLEVAQRALERDGHHVSAVRTPNEATDLLDSTTVEVIVLDVMLENASGLDFCNRLRSEGSEVPILFLSARGAVHARLDGFEAGGDDYLSKPFALKELVARVRALGRRGPAIRAQRLTMGDLSLDFDARRATATDGEVPVTRREWDILRTLADAKGHVVTFDLILERVWGEVTPSTRASLDVIVSRLRKKLDGAAGRPIIRTARGLGYSLELDT